MQQTLLNFVVFLALAMSAAAQTTFEVGEPAPDFELRDSTGELYKLSDYRGEKAVVLEFFRSGDW